MKRKFTALLCSLVLLCVAFVSPFSALAADSSASGTFSVDAKCPTCGGALTYKWWSTLGAEVELKIINNAMVSIPSGSGSLGKLTERCESCGYEKTEWKCLGLQGGSSKPGEVQATKAPSGIGRKDLPGYADDNGTPTVTSTGKLSIQMHLNGYDTSYGYNHVIKTARSSECFASQVSDAGSFSGTGNTLTATNNIKRGNAGLAAISFYLIAPCDGYYTITNQLFNFSYTQCASNGDYYSELESSAASYVNIIVEDNCCFVSENVNYTSTKSLSITRSLSQTVRAAKGQIIGVSACGRLPYNDYAAQSALNISCGTPVLTCEPDSITINQESTITINNNTWNGNIYVDNSNNLTYIYPEYTTINENNETVTNISNNPIIYNNETQQYYTYDSTTNNYYYITYGDAPATPTPSPSPSPTPSPTPSPGTDPTPTPMPGGGSGGGDGGDGGSGSGGSGSSWWEKLLDKLGSAIVDGLLGAISAVLKLIFKLFSTILGWIIWLTSQVLTLFPFLPPGLGALLIGGVVVCFVIGIIKFIRG